MKARTVELKGVAPILLEHSRRARHISVSIRPFKGVRVAVPVGVSFDRAEQFARSKAGWIKKHLEKMQRRQQEAEALAEGRPIDRKAACRQLVERLEQLSRQHGFAYNRVFIKNQKTRWGSCSNKNNINLNINLIRLPSELIDYTILHELVHTRVKNHGPDFWRQLEAVLAGARQLDKKLNDYTPLLIYSYKVV
jgi:predicted metal-dependent hydrolase